MVSIAFAGAAQVEAPLTVDYQTVLDAINQLDTKTVERGGTDITSAIQSAELALGKSEGPYRALVLLTDGEDLEEDAVAAAKDAGILRDSHFHGRDRNERRLNYSGRS